MASIRIRTCIDLPTADVLEHCTDGSDLKRYAPLCIRLRRPAWPNRLSCTALREVEELGGARNVALDFSEGMNNRRNSEYSI